MTKEMFINMVTEQVTEFGSIPIKPKPNALDNIILMAKQYFYQHWAEAQEERYVIINKSVLNSPLFKKDRVIQLPSTVRYITQLQETGSSFFYNDINPDFRKTNFNYTAYAVNADSDTMLTAVTYAYYMDFIKQFVLRTIAFSYSDKSHKLFLAGRDQIGNDIAARAYVDLDEEDLFETNIFLRWVIAQCRLSASRAFTLISMKGLGGGSFNWSDIKEAGKEEIAEIKKEMSDDDSGAAFFMLDGEPIG